MLSRNPIPSRRRGGQRTLLKSDDKQWGEDDFHTAAFAAQEMLQKSSAQIDFEKLKLLLDSHDPFIRI